MAAGGEGEAGGGGGDPHLAALRAGDIAIDGPHRICWVEYANQYGTQSAHEGAQTCQANEVSDRYLRRALPEDGFPFRASKTCYSSGRYGDGRRTQCGPCSTDG